MNRASKIKILTDEMIEDYDGIMDYNDLKSRVSQMSNDDLDKELSKIFK